MPGDCSIQCHFRGAHGSVGSYNQPFPIGSLASECTAFPWVWLSPQFESSCCFLLCFQRSMVFVSGRGHSNLMDRASFLNLGSRPLSDARALMAGSELLKNLSPDLRLEAVAIVSNLGKPSPPSLFLAYIKPLMVDIGRWRMFLTSTRRSSYIRES